MGARGVFLAARLQEPQLSRERLDETESLRAHCLCAEDERRILSGKRINVRLASPAASLRRPSYLAELGWRRGISGQVDDPATLAPVYLHSALPIPGA